MTMKTTLEKIQEAIAQFKFTAREESGIVKIYNNKNVFAATVENGKVTKRYQGQKTLCGSLVVNAINSALS